MNGASPNTLPCNWVRTDIGTAYNVLGGGTPSTSVDEYWGGDTPWITSADIDGVREINVSRFVTHKGIGASATNKVPSRTLLVATRVGLGKVALTDGPLCFSQDLQGLVQRPDLILPEYGLYFLSFQLQRLKFEGRGTTISGITKKQLKDTQFPLPPYQEQHRIVAKIEELYFELDNGAESLKMARAQLKVYRQAVLKQAFEGKLTAQWREENKDKLETAEKLLARIKQERETRYQHQLSDWKTSATNWHDEDQQRYKPKKPLKPKLLPALSIKDLNALEALPSEWRWVRIGEIGLVGTGVTPLKSKAEYYRDGDIAWLTSGALNDPFIQSPSGYVTDTAYNETSLRIYPPHTLVVALYGEGKTRGKCSETLFETTTNQAIAAIVQEDTTASLRGILRWFLTKNYQEVRLGSSGGVQPNLNLGIIENTAVPICPVSEAKEIQKEIEVRFSWADELEKQLASCLRQTELLRQSILNRAFSGKLVAQDTNDKPASALLERIRAEKPSQKPSAKTRQRKVANA